MKSETEKLELKLELRRSLVRIWVTYGAAGFLFVGGALMIAVYLFKDSYAEAKEVFLTILPVSSAVISFWFAGRSPSDRSRKGGDSNQQAETGNKGKA